MEGYAIGYDIFEGNTYEGHKLIPFLEKITARFELGKPVVVADAGPLSNDNLKALQAEGYQYILGARIKNEPEQLKQYIQKQEWKEGKVIRLSKKDDARLIVAYSQKRARKDEHNRQRGLNRLEKQIKRGKLTKANINNRGYNKYLKLEGELTVKVDYEKFKADQLWDGLKGYVTNTKLTNRRS